MVKKYGQFVFILLAGMVLLVALIRKNELNDLISRQIQKQNSAEVVFNAEKYIATHFNYTENKQDFNFTLLQFKSTGCAICKQMEPELEMLSNSKDEKINVVAIQVMNPDSQEMMKYYGISVTPTQILLDKNGNEFFRKYGFISAEDLTLKFHEIFTRSVDD